MRICSKCGAEINDDAKSCGYCGNAFTDEVENITVSENTFTQDRAERPKNVKQKITFGQVLTSAVIIVIVGIISAVGGKLLASLVDKNEIGDVEEYTAKVQSYVPGNIDRENGEYTSAFWGLKADLSGAWNIIGDEEMKKSADDLREVLAREMYNLASGSGKSAELCEKYSASTLVFPEFTMTGNGVSFQMYTITSYGFAGLDGEKIVEWFYGSDDCIGVTDIGGTEYYTYDLSGDVEVQGLTSKMYLYAKDEMLSYILYVANADGKQHAEDFIRKDISENRS